MRRTKDTNESGWTLHWPELALLLWLLFVALAGSAAAQSTDPKSPTPLTAGEISGGEIGERASYYFTFEAGPGEVTAALEATMKKGSKGAGVGVELLDASAKSLAGALLSGGLDAGKEKIENELFKQLGRLTSAADSLGGDTKQKTARVKVKTRQPLVLRLTVDKGVESFTLRVGGAVEFAPAGGETTQADATAGTTPADQTAPTAEATPTGEAAPPAPDVQPASGQPAVKVIPGPKSVLLKIPGKQAQPPARPAQQSKPPAIVQKQQPAAKRPAVVLIPGKKQP